MKRTDLCILIPTFPACVDVARFTASRIEKFWPGHPPLFFCGLEGGQIPASSLEADWMSILLEACDVLWKGAFRKIYLLLDDHPPLGPCHSLHLNRTLPAILQNLGAVSISLLGPGQGRQAFGSRVVMSGFPLDHVPSDQLWKFSLHPALWNLEILRALLRGMISFLPPADRTPWAFERRGGAADAPLPSEWKSGNYRIQGRTMRLQVLHPFASLTRRAARGLELAAALIKKRSAVQRRFGFIRHIYDGPYPLLWSGLMKKQEVNPDFLYYTQILANQDFLENLPQRFLR